MKILTKIISLTLSLIIACSFLTACGDKDNKNSSESNKNSSQSSLNSENQSEMEENSSSSESSSNDDSSSEKVEYSIKNGSFESGDLEGWTIVYGEAFEDDGVSELDKDINFQTPYNKDGRYFYGRHKEDKFGLLRSSVFTSKGFLSFKLGGGKNTALMYISIIESESGKELYRFGNSEFCSERSDLSKYHEADLVQYVAQIPDAKGKKVYIEITDNSTCDWGLLTFDSFVSNYDEMPNLDGVLANDIKPVFNSENISENMENADFSNGLNGWSIAYGNAFNESHIKNNILNNRSSEKEVGVLRSPLFKVGGCGVVSLRLGAFKNSLKTFLSVREFESNREIHRIYNSRRGDGDEEGTHLYAIDLSLYKGKNCYFEIVDNSSGDWGLVIVEKIETYHEKVPDVTDEIGYDIKPSTFIPQRDFKVMRTIMYPIIEGMSNENNLKTIFKNCFYATIDGVNGLYPSVMKYNSDGTTFVLTGDIPAMWLRDSSAQVVQYFDFLNVDPQVKSMVKGLILKQLSFIRKDSYANAFNENSSVFERKFEIDSLCYPIWLAYNYYKKTGDTSFIDGFFVKTCQHILNTFENEMNHSDEIYDINSISSHDKNKYPVDVNKNIGLIYNGYRPSDDVCKYKYLIPSNMFASVITNYMGEMIESVNKGSEIAKKAKAMSLTIRNAIESYGTIEVDGFGKIYAFEVDGFGGENAKWNGNGEIDHFNLMDDANIPSLLSAPWLGYCSCDDEIYQNTRKFILSENNPYYFKGESNGIIYKGIGSEHTPKGRIWHMALAMQMMTTNNKEEINSLLEMMLLSTGGKNVMHEGFDCNNPQNYSRDWFTWPCSLFSQAVMKKVINFSLD